MHAEIERLKLAESARGRGVDDADTDVEPFIFSAEEDALEDTGELVEPHEEGEAVMSGSHD